MANKTNRIIICLVLLFIAVNVIGYACEEGIFISNNSLFVDKFEVIVMKEKQKAYYHFYNGYYLIIITPFIIEQQSNALLYNSEKKQLDYISISFFDNVYFWNSLLIYKINKKNGGWVLFDTENSQQRIANEWSAGFYIINDELSIKSLKVYKSLISGREYKLDSSFEKIVPLEGKEGRGKEVDICRCK